MESVKQELKMRARQQLPPLAPRCSLRAGNPHVFVLIPNQRNCFFWVEIWKSMTSCQTTLSSAFPVPPAELSWNNPGCRAGTEGCGCCQRWLGTVWVLAAGPEVLGGSPWGPGAPRPERNSANMKFIGVSPQIHLPQGTGGRSPTPGNFHSGGCPPTSGNLHPGDHPPAPRHLHPGGSRGPHPWRIPHVRSPPPSPVSPTPRGDTH